MKNKRFQPSDPCTVTLPVDMKPFIVSHIVGYDSHLPTNQVRLPLKYLPDMIPDDTEVYKDNCLGHGEFIDVSSQQGHFFSLIEAGITSDLRRIRLIPILTDEAASLGVQFKTLEFLLPHPIIGKGTFTYHFVPLSSESEPYIIIDIIDQSYLLITLRIELSDFVMGNVKNRLVLDNFSEWVNISVPYLFELRSSPFLMKSIDAFNLIVSMNDGGLLHFRRKNPLSSVDIFNFSELTPLISLNFMGNLLSRSNKHDVLIGGLSHNTAVDLVQLNDDEFVTFSLNQSVKVYNLKSHKQTETLSQLTNSKANLEWVTNVPNKYFQIHHALSKKLLSLMVPVEDKEGHEDIPTYGFASWDISRGQLESFNFLRLTRGPRNPDESSSVIKGESTSLKAQDFQIIEQDSTLEYYVLYKSNTYSEVVCFSQAKSTGAITSFKTSLPQQVCVPAELSTHRGSNYYISLVFNSGLCDKRIVTSALDIFTQNAGNIPAVDPSLPLRQKVMLTVNFVSNAKGISESSTWYKFALVCLELRRSSQEALSIIVQNNFILCSEVNGVGVYREAHLYETKYHDRASNAITELANSVSSKLSSRTLRRLLEEAASDSSIDVIKAENLATKYLTGKILDEESNSFMLQLGSIPEVVEQMKNLIGMRKNDEDILDFDDVPAAGVGAGLLSMLLTVDTFESIKKCHETLLGSLFVLLLLSEANENVVEFMNAVMRRLRVYGIITEVFNICFSSSGSQSPIEHATVSSKENSLFLEVCVKNNAILRHLIQEKKYNEAFDYYSQDVLTNNCDSTLLSIVIELLNRGDSGVVMQEFVPKLDSTTPINSFLIGVTSLLDRKFENFYDRLTDYSLFEHVNNDASKEILLNHLQGNRAIHEFFTSIFIGPSDSLVTKSNYYHQLSQLISGHDRLLGSETPTNQDIVSERQHLLELALKLEDTAIEILSGTLEANATTQLISSYLRNHFHIAVESKHFEEAAASLSKIKSLASKSDFKLLFTKLFKTLLKLNKYGVIFMPGLSDIFIQNYAVVDSILLELANEDLVLSNALKCYELLYSWRLLGPAHGTMVTGTLADKRGAAEALYIFITRFQNEQESLRVASEQSEDFQQFKLKVLELYKIVLTTLRSFSNNDDKWIRKRGDNKTWRVITLTELDIEYHRWLKELEGDFAEI